MNYWDDYEDDYGPKPWGDEDQDDDNDSLDEALALSDEIAEAILEDRYER